MSCTCRSGLNLICAPNESGKSTWGSFICAMLYGLSTRDRGLMADKNRFAPWSGAAMQGRMDILSDGRALTLQRDTRRANAPMGNFSCTYTGTGTPVEGIAARTPVSSCWASPVTCGNAALSSVRMRWP